MANLHKIFLVEDDLNFGGVLKAYLEMNNYEVKLIDDGRKATQEFQKDLYSICILDVELNLTAVRWFISHRKAVYLRHY